MKRLSALLRTLLCALALTLCATLALAADAPNLVGTWEGVSSLHGPIHGHRSGSKALVVVIKEQKGYAFTGTKTYFNELKKKEFSENFSGTVSSEGLVSIAEHEDGTAMGKLRADGILELQYAEPGKDAKAIHVLLKKIK